MNVAFHKFQANGNDFVVIDGSDKPVEISSEQIRLLCDRHFGIGADGLMIILPDREVDYEMQYFNADGKIGTLCGNGGRCIAGFHQLKFGPAKKIIFKATDGLHKAKINEVLRSDKVWDVSLSINDVTELKKENGFYLIDTGSPHYVEFVQKLAEMNVFEDGKKTRFSERFAPGGVNVNFVEIGLDRLFVRTYERGVERETLSCGTGVTASAIAAFLETGKKGFSIHTTGGDFRVDFDEVNGCFKNIWLSGPAELVYSGSIEL